MIKAIFVPTNVRRNKDPHLDNLGAFYYLLVVGDRRGTCTSRNNIGPLWGNQVPEPRGEGINGNKVSREPGRDSFLWGQWHNVIAAMLQPEALFITLHLIFMSEPAVSRIGFPSAGLQ